MLVGDLLERIELGDVVPGHDHGDLEAAEPGGRQAGHRRPRRPVRPAPADRVVDLFRGAIQRDLHVDVVAGGQPPGGGGVELDPVRRELDPDLVRGRVVQELPEVRPHRRLAAADVDVKHLHPLEGVDDGPALGGR